MGRPEIQTLFDYKVLRSFCLSSLFCLPPFLSSTLHFPVCVSLFLSQLIMHFFQPTLDSVFPTDRLCSVPKLNIWHLEGNWIMWFSTLFSLKTASCLFGLGFDHYFCLLPGRKKWDSFCLFVCLLFQPHGGKRFCLLNMVAFPLFGELCPVDDLALPLRNALEKGLQTPHQACRLHSGRINERKNLQDLLIQPLFFPFLVLQRKVPAGLLSPRKT